MGWFIKGWSKEGGARFLGGAGVEEARRESCREMVRGGGLKGGKLRFQGE